MSNRDELCSIELEGQPRVVFFGMRCAFSIPPLLALLAAPLDLKAVILPGARGSGLIEATGNPDSRVIHLKVSGSLPSIEQVTTDAGVSLLYAGAMDDPEFISQLKRCEPDVIAVACFPWLIPESIRSIPRFGCINLHPSLLPRWRGPEPIFWTFMAGDTETGVTVHLMDDGFDTGPILGQRVISLPDGIDGASLETDLAREGGELLVQVIENQVIGVTNPQMQDESFATFAPIPGDSDLLLSADTPARDLFNRIRGVTPLWGDLSLRIPTSGRDVTVKQALDFDPSGVLAEPAHRLGEIMLVRCNPGVITLLVR